MDTYYEVLGVPPEAGSREVKSAFRRQAKKHHPDLRREDGLAPRARGPPTRPCACSSRPIACSAIPRSAGPTTGASEEGGRGGRLRLPQLPQGAAGDPESQAKLVVFDLLHGLEDEALEVYERAKSLRRFSPRALARARARRWTPSSA